MILYKNVDICDLKSIMEKGILSLDACGNNNWDDGKRGTPLQLFTYSSL